MKSIELTVLEGFECIGGECPQSCCQNFNITIESDTYQKWKKLDNIIGEGSLDNNITQAEQGGQRCDILKADNNRCNLLDAENWCQVQKKYGHDALPLICQTFPRHNLDNNMAKVITATLSCPVITKKIFHLKQSSAFNLDLGQLFILERPVIAGTSDKIRYYLAAFVNKVFSLNKTRLSHKLFYIAHCTGLMNEQLVKNGFNEDSFDLLFAKPKEALFDINRGLKSKKLVVDPVTAGSYWKSIAALFLTRNITLESVDLEKSPLMKLCARDISGEEFDTNQQFEHYREIYSLILSYKVQWEKNRPAYFPELFERYIITSFINKGFPLHPQDEQFSATLVFVMTAASAIQLALWMAYSEGLQSVAENSENDINQPNEDQLHQIFYQIESALGHTDTIFYSLASDPHMVQIDRYALVFLDIFT